MKTWQSESMSSDSAVTGREGRYVVGFDQIQAYRPTLARETGDGSETNGGRDRDSMTLDNPGS